MLLISQTLRIENCKMKIVNCFALHERDSRLRSPLRNSARVKYRYEQAVPQRADPFLYRVMRQLHVPQNQLIFREAHLRSQSVCSFRCEIHV